MASLDPIAGLIVNPIAGLGGSVGLKGTDGPGMAERAVALGARPAAGLRAAKTLSGLMAAWPEGRALPEIYVGPGAMGEDAAALARWRTVSSVGQALEVTTAADTRELAAALASLGVDLLLFAGGDGTARDVLAAVGTSVVVLGIPAGVKVQSGVFATGPAAAGWIAAGHLASRRARTEEREVVDLDEDAYRAGHIAPRLHGLLRVPAGRGFQARKEPTPASDAYAAAAIAADVVAALVPRRRYVLGPGSTVRAIGDALGVSSTLVGVDVIEAALPSPIVIAADGGERQVREAVEGHDFSIVVTPIGGQGFLFGRGNQPIAADLIRRAGRDGLLVVATPAKLASLRGRPLLVDTGDPELDRQLAGHISVVTGHRERIIVPIEAG